MGNDSILVGSIAIVGEQHKYAGESATLSILCLYVPCWPKPPSDRVLQKLNRLSITSAMAVDEISEPVQNYR